MSCVLYALGSRAIEPLRASDQSQNNGPYAVSYFPMIQQFPILVSLLSHSLGTPVSKEVARPPFVTETSPGIVLLVYVESSTVCVAMEQLHHGDDPCLWFRLAKEPNPFHVRRARRCFISSLVQTPYAFDGWYARRLHRDRDM